MLMFLLGMVAAFLFSFGCVVLICYWGTREIPKDFPARPESPTQKVKLTKADKAAMIMKSGAN